MRKIIITEAQHKKLLRENLEKIETFRKLLPMLQSDNRAMRDTALTMASGQGIRLFDVVDELYRYGEEEGYFTFGVDSLAYMNPQGVLGSKAEILDELLQNPPKEVRLDRFATHTTIDAMTYLPSITQLAATDIGLDKLPDSIGDMQNLRSLDLRHNKLTSLPKSFAKLQNLEYLYLQFNPLGHVPPSLANLKKVKLLNMSHTKLDDIPPFISRMTGLEGIFATGNNLTTLPSTLGTMPNLKVIYVNRNPIEPEELQKLKQQFPNVRIDEH